MKRSLLLTVPLLLVACGGGAAKPNGPDGGAKPGAAPPPPAARGAAMADAGAGPALPLPKAQEYGENEFTESDRNRDPFRSYAGIFADQGKRPTQNQRTVLLSQYAIDELRLVAIVTGGDYPRAMLVDPTKKGWVVRKGDFVGRPEVVHVGGANGADYQLNWRVDRVRDGDIVLTREDPVQQSAAPVTRVIPLRNEPEEARTN
jgi:type IV pilus assembly protein PilP